MYITDRAIVADTALHFYISWTIQLDLNDIHREKALSNKTTALRRSANMGIWVVGTSN